MNLWKTRLRTLGIGAAWAFVVLSVLWVAAYVWTGHMLEQEKSAARKIGSLDFWSLCPPMPPAKDNGIWDLEHAAGLIHDRALEIGRTPAHSRRPEDLFWTRDLTNPNPWDSDALARASLAISKSLEIGELCRKAADAPTVRYDLSLQRGGMLLSLLLPHLNKFNQSGHYLRACARVEASEGRSGEAMDDVGRIAHLARSAEAEPTMIAGLIGAALRQSACREADALLSTGARIDMDRLARLSESLRTDPGILTRVFLGERCFGIDTFDRMIGGEISLADMASSGMGGCEGPTLGGSLLTFPARPWLRWEAAAHLSFFNAVIPGVEDLHRPLPEPHIRGAILCNMLLPAVDRARATLGAGRARSDLTRWGLAVLRHRLRTGRLPASLDEIQAELMPDQPLDAYSGKAFAYQPAPDGASFSIRSALVEYDGKPIGISWKVAP